MRRLPLILIALLLCGLQQAGAQSGSEAIPLYISKQTGEFTDYSGSGSKTTDKHENGCVTVTKSGPIMYSVSPNDFCIGINETKTWDGKVWADVASGPEPGSSVPASVTGNYNVSYSRPCASCPTGHEMVNNATGSETVNFVVHSVKVDAPDSVRVCKGKEIAIMAEGYPADGAFLWTPGAGIQITEGQGTGQVIIKATGNAGLSSVSVKYIAGGVTFTKQVAVRVMDGPTSIQVPNKIKVTPGKQFSITPVGTPGGGSYKWSVSNGLTLVSGPFNYVAFIRAGQTPGKEKATVEYTLCGKTIKKDVEVNIVDCLLEAPDSAWVIKNQTQTIAATGSPEGGTFTWTGGDAKYSIEGGPNTNTVTIKGLQAGKSSISVNFKATDCDEMKVVGIRVLDALSVTIAPTNPPLLCKGNVQGFTATGLPPGGTYSWSAAGPLQFTSATNTPYAWVKATGGGNASVTVTYTLNGQTATKTVNFKCREIKNVEVTAVPNAGTVDNGTTVTYTAKAFDQDGVDVTAEVSFEWEQVVMPYGGQGIDRFRNYKLTGNGPTQTVTWNFSSAPGSNPPAGALMEGWVQAVVWCPVRIGSKHIKVRKPGN